MWRWPLRLSSAPEVLLCALVAGLLMTPTSVRAGEGAPSHLGPASDTEAALLWRDGREDFENGRHEESIPKLRRLIDRYPGYEGFLEAHRLLGISYLETGEAQKALPVLKAYAAAMRKPAESAAAKLLVVRAYLAANRSTEALLLSEEVIAMPLQNEPQLAIEALLLKARSMMKKAAADAAKTDRRAEGALASARKLLASATASARTLKLRSEANLIALELKHRACSRLPIPGPLSEAQVIDQLDRRGACLLESLPLARDALVPEARGGAPRLAATRTVSAFQAYASSCLNPPDPAGASRTPKELKMYREELTRVLAERCRARLATAVETLLELQKTLDQDELKRTVQGIRSASQSLPGAPK